MVSAARIAVLPSRAAVAVTGPDAADFLQGLISNDIRKAKAEQAIYAALLSPQGRFLFDFIIVPWAESFLLDSEASRADEVVKRLNMYKLRAQVTIARLPEITVAACWNGAPLPGAFADPRLNALGSRLYGAREAIAPNATEEEYDAYRLTLGVPDGSRDFVVDRSLLLEFGFEELQGVDFAKGCYVGQEVTARSKHRAQLRKALHRVRADAALPEAGSEITQDGKAVGEMRSHRGCDGLAILQLEAVCAQAGGAKLLCGGVELYPSLPEWMEKALASAAD